jgi:hypothetical protein
MPRNHRPGDTVYLHASICPGDLSNTLLCKGLIVERVRIRSRKTRFRVIITAVCPKPALSNGHTHLPLDKHPFNKLLGKRIKRDPNQLWESLTGLAKQIYSSPTWIQMSDRRLAQIKTAVRR